MEMVMRVKKFFKWVFKYIPDDYDHENNSPAQQRIDESKNKRGKTYQMEDLDIQEYERAPPTKKRNIPKHEALSD